MKLFFYVLIYFIILNCINYNLKGQDNNKKINEKIFECLVFGDFHHGVEIQDTNKVIRSIYCNKTECDTSEISYNYLGRIVSVKTKNEYSEYTYNESMIEKKTIKHFPKEFAKKCDTLYYVFYYTKNKIDSVTASCLDKMNKIQFDYIYSQCNNIQSVKILKDSVFFKNEIFTYDNSSLKWETVNSFGGIRLNFYNNYKVKECVSHLFFDTSIGYGIIRNKLKVNGRWKYPPDKYTIFDFLGNIYGNIEIIRYTYTNLK